VSDGELQPLELAGGRELQRLLGREIAIDAVDVDELLKLVAVVIGWVGVPVGDCRGDQHDGGGLGVVVVAVGDCYVAGGLVVVEVRPADVHVEHEAGCGVGGLVLG